jgi:hypothetical protein
MVFFSEGGFLCFCRGFWGKRVVERGFLMVNLWWDCGDFVVNGWSYFGVEKSATDSGFIFWGFPFWEWVGEGLYVSSDGGFGLG